MKSHKFRLIHINNAVDGTYFKVQQKKFWGWKDIYFSDIGGLQLSKFFSYNIAEQHLELAKELDKKGIIQKF